jgi:hypothetical protein
MAKKKLGTLYYDDRKEEGVFKIDEHFWGEHRIIQLDILQDWAYGFTDLYNETLENLDKKDLTNDEE